MRLGDTQPIRPRVWGDEVGVYTPKTVGSAKAIRKFGDQGIEAAMQKVLKNLPRGKRGAVVMYADKDGVRGAVYGRQKGKLWFLPPGEWSYVGTLGTTYKGHLEAGAAVSYSWP
jgi:hypothetical protein